MNNRTDKIVIMKRADKIFVFIVFMIIFIGFLIVSYFKNMTGTEVQILIDGKLQGSYRLDEDQEIPIVSKNGNFNTIIISNGQVYIKKSDCRNQLCVKQGPISNPGESIICLPHRLSVKIVGDKANNDNKTLDNNTSDNNTLDNSTLDNKDTESLDAVTY